MGGVLNFQIQRWRYGIDRWTVITDELCEEIVSLADLSAEFWLKKRTAKNAEEMALLQVRIQGSVARIDALKEPFEDWCPKGALRRFMPRHGELVDAATGGQFTSREREADTQAALKVQTAAAELVGVIRNSLKQGIGFRARLDRAFSKK